MKTIIIDGVEYNLTPKVTFREGDWVILTAGELSTTLQIVKVDTNKKLYWFNDSSYLSIVDEECLHLWIIEGAKAGDVLATKAGGIFIYKELLYDKPFAYCGVDKFGVFKDCNCGDGLDWTPYLNDVTPATKEQRDILFQKMHEAGYEWNAEKLELKKVEQKPAGWSEKLIADVFEKVGLAKIVRDQENDAFTEALQSAMIELAKYIVVPQPRQEWSDEDEYLLDETIKHLESLIRITKKHGSAYSDEIQYYQRDIDWLNSLKDRCTWKPSKEQIQAVKEAACYSSVFSEKTIDNLISLSKQLKKLREE